MIEHINNIDMLSDQISSILSLMMLCEDGLESIKTASEMCLNMHEELMQEIEKIKEEYKENKIVEKLPGDYMDEMIQRGE